LKRVGGVVAAAGLQGRPGLTPGARIETDVRAAVALRKKPVAPGSRPGRGLKQPRSQNSLPCAKSPRAHARGAD